jgi:hypothetical protein
LNRNAADGKRQSESLKSCADNCTPSESVQKPLRRSRRLQRGQSPVPLRERLRRAYGGLGGGGCSGGDLGPKTIQLLKAMREQLGDTSASRSVDAVAAAEALGMDTTTHDFDRRLQDLVRAGYLEPDPHSAAPGAQGLYRITFAGLDAADGY